MRDLASVGAPIRRRPRPNAPARHRRPPRPFPREKACFFSARLAFPRKLRYPVFMQNDRPMLSRIFFVMMAERHWRSHL